MCYPDSLRRALLEYGAVPTGDPDWDKALLVLAKQRGADTVAAYNSIGSVVERVGREQAKRAQSRPDLSNPEVYRAHADLLMYIADHVVLASQRRPFVVDDNNRAVIRFLLYYFNDCPLAEEVFPDRGYKLHKNILLQGGVGVGKTMLMQIFSEYLKRTNNPRYFHNVSVTQMVNYFSIHNNIDLFLYNEGSSTGFQINPVHVCLNDIGVDNRPFYGVDTTTIVSDFLHARNEIWTNADIDKRFAHLTTNLPVDKLKQLFNQKDKYGRVEDRFKTYNVIPLPGTSRR